MDVCENFLAALGIFHTSEEWNRPRVVLTCQKIRPPIIAKSRKDESALPHPPPPPAPRDSRELRTSLGVGGCEKIRARRRVCPRHTLPARNHGRALAGRGANTAARLWLPRTYVEAGGSWVNTGQRARRRRKSGANPPREKSIVSVRSRAGAALSSAQARGRLDDGSTTARRQQVRRGCTCYSLEESGQRRRMQLRPPPGQAMGPLLLLTHCPRHSGAGPRLAILGALALGTLHRRTAALRARSRCLS